MNIFSKDLDLLKILWVAGEELNLSRASRRLGLSQPALSHALRKLRQEFSDPLLVRGSRGLVPTERAKALLPMVREVLAQADALYREDRGAGFKSLERSFILGGTTYFELRVLNTLLRDIGTHAPKVVLETRALQEGFPKAELERGEMDLAIAAYFQDLPESFRMKVLGRDPHVCVARKGNPFLSTRKTLKDYLGARHIRIAVPPGKPSAIDVILASHGKKRDIAAHISNFLTPVQVLSRTDYLLTCPATLAQSYVEMYPLEVVRLPIAVPPVEIKMVWHERSQSDPFHQWMRERITQSLEKEKGPG